MAKKVPRVWGIQYDGGNGWRWSQQLFTIRREAQAWANNEKQDANGPLKARVVELVPKTKGEAR